MDIRQLANSLRSYGERNSALQLLYDITVDTDPALIDGLADIISDPESISNTTDFSSLLDYIGADEFIQPLIEAIRKGKPGEDLWLTHYLYALGNILEERDDHWVPEEDFVHLVGSMLLYTGGGQISWYASIILADLEHHSTREYLIKGAKDPSLVHLARTTCMRGLIHHYREDAVLLLEDFSEDPEPEVREFVAEALDWLYNSDVEG